MTAFKKTANLSRKALEHERQLLGSALPLGSVGLSSVFVCPLAGFWSRLGFDAPFFAAGRAFRAYESPSRITFSAHNDKGNDMADQWHYMKGDQQHGPVTSEQLKHLARSGALMRSDMLWKEGMKEWVVAGRVKGLFPASVPPAVGRPQPIPTAVAQKPPKTRAASSVQPSPIRSTPPPSVGPSEPATSGDNPTSLLSSLAQRGKAAAQLVAKQAQRTKLTTMTLPAAYQALGRQIVESGRYRTDFASQYGAIDAPLKQIQVIQGRSASEPKAEGIAAKAKAAATATKDAAQTKALQMKVNHAFGNLAKAAFDKYGARSGPESVTRPIADCLSRIQQLDVEIGNLTETSSSQILTPKRLAIGAGSLIILVLAIVGFALLSRGGSRSSATAVARHDRAGDGGGNTVDDARVKMREVLSGLPDLPTNSETDSRRRAKKTPSQRSDRNGDPVESGNRSASETIPRPPHSPSPQPPDTPVDSEDEVVVEPPKGMCPNELSLIDPPVATVPSGGLVAFSPSGNVLLTADSSNVETARLWEVGTWKERPFPFTVTAGATTSHATFLLNGTMMAIWQSGTLNIWRLGEDTPVWNANGFPDVTYWNDLVSSRDGKTLVSRRSPTALALWRGDWTNGSTSPQVMPVKGYLLAKAISPNGEYLVTVTADSLPQGSERLTATIWNLSAGQSVAHIPLGRQVWSNGYDSFGFSPDGRLLALPVHQKASPATNDKPVGMVKLYDTSTWKELMTLTADAEWKGSCWTCSPSRGGILAKERFHCHCLHCKLRSQLYYGNLYHNDLGHLHWETTPHFRHRLRRTNRHRSRGQVDNDCRTAISKRGREIQCQYMGRHDRHRKGAHRHQGSVEDRPLSERQAIGNGARQAHDNLGFDAMPTGAIRGRVWQSPG